MSPRNLTTSAESGPARGLSSDAAFEGGGQANGPVSLTLTVTLSSGQLDELASRVAALLAGRDGGAAAPTWLDARGAAAHLACSVGRIHDLVALGRLTPRRDGRRLLFRRVELDAYVEAAT